jgi:5-methylcytosine-specific restriction endonuclease McrA
MSRLSSKGSTWEGLRKAVLERDQGLCAYCGREATTADHVIPKAQGGLDTMDNLVAACLKCNGAKQDKILLRTSGYNPNWLDGLW